MATFGDILSNITIGASQSIRRNVGDSAFEAYTPSSSGHTHAIYITGATNLGSGDGTIYSSISNQELQLKTISGGTNVTITCNANYISISSNDASGIEWSGSTASGVGIYAGSDCICSAPNLTFNGSLLDVTGDVYATSCIYSPLISGTTFATSSSSLVSNFNADLLDGFHASQLTGDTAAVWGNITGTINDQTDLCGCLEARMLCTNFNTFTGTTLPANYYDKTEINSYTGITQTDINNRLSSSIFNTFTGTTLPANYYNETEINSYTGQTNTCLTNLQTDVDVVSGLTETNDGRLDYIEPIYVTGATNIGSGDGTIFTSVADNILQLKTISGGTNVTITNTGNHISISSNDASGIEWSGTTVSGVGIYAGSDCICSAPNLTFNGTRLNVIGNIYASSCIYSPLISGTTFATSSNSVVSNFNADLLDGFHASELTGDTAAVWGNITGTITDQTDLCGCLEANIIGYTCLTNRSTSIGCCAMPYCSSGVGNTAYGVYALNSNTIGDYNIAIGACTLKTNTNGFSNIAIGDSALEFNISGSYNIAIGDTVLSINTGGSYNIAMGDTSLAVNTSGCENIAFGYRPMYSNTIGCGNIAFQSQALYCNICGCYNIAQGTYSLCKNTCGCYNIAHGYSALPSNISGKYNIAIGGYSLLNNICGNCNVGIGENVFQNNQTGNTNVAIGYSAGSNETGSNRLYIANSASCSLIYGEFDNKLVCIDEKLTTCQLQVINGATDGYVLTSDVSGNALWQASSGITSGNTLMVSCSISGNDTITGWTVTHSLGTLSVMIEVYKDVSPYRTIYTDVSRPTADTVCVTFENAPATGCDYVVLVNG